MSKLRAAGTSRKFLAATVSTMALALAGNLMVATSAEAIPYRDDVGLEDTIAFAQGWDGVVQIFMLNEATGGIFFNCTGSMINARTVISAAHCFNSSPTSVYGFGGGGLTPIVAYGEDTFDALFNYIFTGQQFIDPLNGLTFGTELLMPAEGEFGGFPFPGADVAMIPLLDPLYTLPSYGMLFSPIPTDVFDAGVHVNMIGYGTFHPGSTDAGPIDGKRKAGENMLGFLGSQNDYFNGLANAALYGGSPSSDQVMYWTDFDEPNRTGTCERGADPFLLGNDSIVCSDWDGFSGVQLDGDTLVLPGSSIDYFPGDALPNEAATAGGDSGGPLMAMNIFDQPLILGVLSGGFIPGFFHEAGQSYGEVSYYNPLFAFHSWISENNPYKYVSANAGDGNWSDADHWVQTMDPNYFIYDGEGNIVNGLPTTESDGINTTSPREGIVFDNPVEDNTTAPAPAGQEGSGVSDKSVQVSETLTGGIPTLGDVSQDDSADGLVTAIGGTGALTSSNQSGDAESAIEDPTRDFVGNGLVAELGFDLIGEASGDRFAASGVSIGAATGPGSTGFVPNNNYGFGADVAQFFEVTLDAAGTTTLDLAAVEIDKLNIRGDGAELYIPSTSTLDAIINVELYGGRLDLDGTVNTRELVLWGGELTGDGSLFTIDFNSLFGNGVFVPGTLFNIAGTFTPGDFGETGSFSLFGDYVQAAAGVMVVDIGNAGDSDMLDVTGSVSLDGFLAVTPVAGYLPAWGDSFTFLQASGTVIGDFAAVSDLPGVLRPVVNLTSNSASIQIIADDFADQANFTNNFQSSLGEALDDGRASSYGDLAQIYGIVDLLSGDQLANAFTSLAPTDAILFDRGVRTHNDVLSGALRSHIGDFDGAAGTGSDRSLLAEMKQSDGLLVGNALGDLARAGVKRDGHGDHEGGSDTRLFGSVGLITGASDLIDSTLQGEFSGTYGLIGADRAFGPFARFGVAAGIAESEGDGRGQLAATGGRVTSTQLSVFGSLELHGFHASAALGYSDHETTMSRLVNLAGATASQRTEFEADGTSYDLHVAYNLTQSKPDMRIAPFVGLTGSDMDFADTQSTGLVGAVAIAARSYTSSIARYGVGFDYDLGQNAIEAQLAFAEELEDPSDIYSASFLTAPGVGFSAATALQTDDWIEFGAAFSHEFAHGGEATIGAEFVMDNAAYSYDVISVEYTLPF